MEERARLRERWREYQPSKTAWFWSCAACIVGTMVVGFAWGGWVTHGTAAKMAADASQTTRNQLAAAICVTRFEAAPNAAAELAQLKKTDSWQQADFVTNGGWVTLPGVKEPVSDAADLCVQQLLTAKLPVTKASATPIPPPAPNAG